MEIGLTLVADMAPDQSHADAATSVLELCAAAEARGIARVWFTEHHHNPTRVSSSIPVLMAAVGAKSTLRMGAATLLPALSDPVRLAEAMGTVESLWPGRTLWGFGKGGRSEITHTHVAGITPETAREAMLRNIDTLAQIRDGVSVVPAPSAAAPWFVATRNPAAVRYAASRGMGLMFGHKWPLWELEGIVSAYRAAHPRQEAPQVMLSRYFLCDGDADAAQQKSLEHFGTRRSRMQALGRALSPETSPVDFSESLVGSPLECLKRMARFEAMGITHLSLRPVSERTADIERSLAHLGL